MPLLSFLSLALLLGDTAPVRGQARVKATADDDVVKVDFRHSSRELRVVFDDEGMYLQAPFKVFLAGLPHVAIEADLTEPGRFEAELLKPSDLVEVRDARIEPDSAVARYSAVGRQRAMADVVAKIQLLDQPEAERLAEAKSEKLVEEVREHVKQHAGRTREGDMRFYLAERRGSAPDDLKELKKTYLRVRTSDETQAELAGKIQELAERRPDWYLEEVEKRTFNADVDTLRLVYRDLLFPRIAEEYLQSLTFKPIVEADDFADYVARVKKRLDGVYLVLSGQSRDPQLAAKAEDLLGVGDSRRLRKAYFAEGVCRFFPETDPHDPNAQWFDGERIATRATGIASIRVEGRLDPRRHDRVDWWILERYDPTQVHLDWPRDAGFRVDPPYPSQHGARLRVVAAGELPVDYHFELRPADKHGGLKVVVYESPAKFGATFPY
ncbi:MAG TPA: hypothetical protein VGX78_13795 [Pirellulales bacterium]|nr:hypothetical protein [Pirellulales bacterium]